MAQAETGTSKDAAAEVDQYYWKQTRENLLTESGVRMFQIALKHMGEPYNTAREEIDAEYGRLSPRLLARGGSKRHGGIFNNYISLFEELGLMYRKREEETEILHLTPAGEQAALLLKNMPNYLRVIPYFLIELLSRYRFKNPQNKNEKNANLAKEIEEGDIFPYWSLYRIMRSLGDSISKDELARFVFRIKRMSEIDDVIRVIRRYRERQKAGVSSDELDREFGERLHGAIAQPKYIMGRAGYQAGVIALENGIYTLKREFIPFIDTLLENEPVFEEIDEETWMREYGKPLLASEEVLLPPLFSEIESATEVSVLPDDNLILKQVNLLIREDLVSGILLIGPPGTGKTWYARQIALKLVEADLSRVREVQFHPSYQYEDFVEGYVPDGKGGFKLVNRHLLEMATKCLQDDRIHVLVIDELSRTDPARVMGEALTYMDTSMRGRRFFLPSNRPATIPPNLLFIATMNPEDRSVDEIDNAMDRRWGKVSLDPDPAIVAQFLNKNGFQRSGIERVIRFFNSVQQECSLGHAYFRGIKNIDSLRRLWDSQLQYLFKKAFRYDPEKIVELQARWSEMLSDIENENA